MAAAGGRVVLGPLGAMTAFDQLTGDLLWTKPESPNRFSQGVAISGDFVIGAYTWRDATAARVLVTARRLSTGRLEWSRWYAAPNGSSASVAGPVTVRYGKVYVALNNGRVHALDVRTGAPITGGERLRLCCAVGAGDDRCPDSGWTLSSSRPRGGPVGRASVADQLSGLVGSPGLGRTAGRGGPSPTS